MRAMRLMGKEMVTEQDIPTPCLGPDDLLARVSAVGVCETDLHFYRRGIEEYGGPITLGHEFAAEVAGVGAGVTDFRIGDRIVMEPCIVCNECRFCRGGRPNLCPTVSHLGLHCDGAFAEYVVAPARNAHHIPDNVSSTAGAQVEPYACALHGLGRARLQPKEDVLIIGDGYFGMVFTQLARALGAGRIVILGHHASRLSRAREEGADVALDERSPEVAELVSSMTTGFGPAVVVDTVGGNTSLARAVALAGRGGRIALFGAASDTATIESVEIILKELDVLGVPSSNVAWAETIALLASGRVHPERLVSQVFPLSDLALAMELKANRAPETIKVVVTP
jgi:threonine dehydrogenase-like Zn-dependent dehydrogenase